jgi:hypothetical protein
MMTLSLLLKGDESNFANEAKKKSKTGCILSPSVSPQTPITISILG